MRDTTRQWMWQKTGKECMPADVYVLAYELVLVRQAVCLECVADVAHAGQQQMDVVAVSCHMHAILTPVVAVQQVNSRTQRPALVDADTS